MRQTIIKLFGVSSWECSKIYCKHLCALLIFPFELEGVKNSMTLGLTDPSPWADNKGEPRAWHNLKYLWRTFEIRKNPKGDHNTSARVILEDTRSMKNPLYKEMFAYHV